MQLERYITGLVRLALVAMVVFIAVTSDGAVARPNCLGHSGLSASTPSASINSRFDQVGQVSTNPATKPTEVGRYAAVGREILGPPHCHPCERAPAAQVIQVRNRDFDVKWLPKLAVASGIRWPSEVQPYVATSSRPQTALWLHKPETRVLALKHRLRI